MVIRDAFILGIVGIVALSNLLSFYLNLMFYIFQYNQCHNQGKEEKANYQMESLFSLPGVSLISNGVIVIVNTLQIYSYPFYHGEA